MVESLFGPYRLDALLGSGGMGEVYRAYDTSQDRVVALKLLHRHLMDDEEYQERFRRESKTTARLREPHVIPIHRFGDVDGRLFIDMRLVEGEDLRTVLARRGRLSPVHAVSVVSQLARAVDAAHAEGLVHRDIKPSNVLVSAQDGDTDTDFVYLVDFGIARSLVPSSQVDLTSTGLAPGTVAYMAPERFAARGASRSVDIYALACVLHECLTGSRPFDYDDMPAMINAHLHTSPPQPSWRGVAAEFDSVIARGMAKKPEDRYATAGELAAAARAALPAGSAPPDRDTAVVDPQRTAQVAPADDLPPLDWSIARRPTGAVSPSQTTQVPSKAADPASRRRTLFAALGVLVLVAAVVAVVLVVPNGNTTAGVPVVAPGSRPPTSAAPPTNQPAAVQDLLAHLPNGIVAANCQPARDPATVGAVATVSCQGPADGPNRAVVARYPDAIAVATAFDAYADGHRITPAYTEPACHDGGNARNEWHTGTDPNTTYGGQLGCYRDAKGAHLVWTDAVRFVLYIGDRSDGSAAALYDWWKQS